MTFPITETMLKQQVKDFLAIKGIFGFPLTQGLASYKGLPDRIIHYKGKVIYLELKTQTGKLSRFQGSFQKQCARDGIDYWVIRSVEELEEKLSGQQKRYKTMV